MYTELNDLIGLKVVAVRGIPKRKNSKHVEAQYVLFSDKKTFVELEKQDYYSYHDCDTAARKVYVIQDRERWARIAGDNFADATEDWF